jgi:hypothetical protein
VEAGVKELEKGEGVDRNRRVRAIAVFLNNRLNKEVNILL